VLRPSIRQGRLLALAVGLAAVIAGGVGVWRLSQGPIGAQALRPAAQRWLASQVAGGRASIGRVGVAWFPDTGSLGLQLDNVELVDGRGRLVLRAQRADAGMALTSMAGLRPAIGRLSARNFFAAISVSTEGGYALGYEARGAPPKTAANLWRVFDDLTGHPTAGRPLSFLQDVVLERGVISLREVGGPVSWTGAINDIHLRKTDGQLQAHVDLRIGDAVLRTDASGAVGLKQARLQAEVRGLVPARVFPWVGATQPLSVLDAPVQGRGALSWTSQRGVEAADLLITAAAGKVRLSGAPTPFQSGEFRAAFDPGVGQVLIQAARVESDQARIDVHGRAWLTPESRQAGPARWRLALDSDHDLLSLSPRLAPAAIDAFVLRASYAPASGELKLEQLSGRLGGAPLAFSGEARRPRLPKSWGADFSGRVDGMLDVRALCAVWPDEFGDEVRDWLEAHVLTGRVGQAQAAIHLTPGQLAPHHPLRSDDVSVSFRIDEAVLQLASTAPAFEHMKGSALLRGDHFDMAVDSAQIQGVQLGQGVAHINRLIDNGKRLTVSARAVGDARAILDAVDRHTGGDARAHGFDPQQLSGQAEVGFTVSRSLDDGPDDYRATYAGVIRQARIEQAALGMTLTAPQLRIEGSLDRLAVQGQVRLGPYRGPLQYVTSFPTAKATVQRAQFDGALDGASIGLSGPAGSDLKFVARFEGRDEGGRGQIRSPAFTGAVDWSFGRQSQVRLDGTSDAAALRSIGAPIGRGVPDKVPVRLLLSQAGAAWSGQLTADAYSGSISYVGGASRRLRYVADLTPAEAQKLGFKAADKATSLALDVSMTGDAGAASYSVGPWLGQVSWSQEAGAKGQYRWRTTLSPADLHSLGLPAGIQPKAPLPVDVTLISASGGWNGSAEVAGGSFRFSASPPVKGRRRLNIGGGADGAALANLGLAPQGSISGPTGLAAALDLGPGGLHGGHVEVDLKAAAVSMPYVPWKKPAGRAMRIDVDFARAADGGWDASSIRGQGPGFGLVGSGLWKAASGGMIRFSDARLEGAFDGALDLGADASGLRLASRARYFDARRLIQQGGQPSGGLATGGGEAGARPLALDVQLGQVRVSETGLVRNVRIAGSWGGGQPRPLDLTVTRDDGSSLIALRLIPDAAGRAINGQVSNVGEAALAVFGQRQFRGGQASVNGRLVQGGADLHVEMSKVRLIQAPALARILTIGSLKGMADTLNGAGIEFAKVTAPVEIRGGRLNIGRARATGPAMGITTQGVIDIDSRTVDLSGGIAPSYALNSAMGSAPVIGALLVPHKGEGVFGLTYSAKGAFGSPKISVNPFSLAAPGILRRIFEAHSAAASLTPAG
jgi:hypothetical protein